jgi:hypothetical protein
MRLLDRLLGRPDRHDRRAPDRRRDPQPPDAEQAARDEGAIARYRYLLRTAPPEAMERAHAEAFTHLTSDQRRQILASLGHDLPGTDWARSYDPHSLARVAIRAETHRPGTLEHRFARGDGSTPGVAPARGASSSTRSSSTRSSSTGSSSTGSSSTGSSSTGSSSAGPADRVGASLLASVAGAIVATAVADALLPDDFGAQDGDLGVFPIVFRDNI